MLICICQRYLHKIKKGMPNFEALGTILKI